MTIDAGGGFNGAKIAVLVENRVLVLLRDDRPDIPYPDFWDLPGGGREDDETPDETALRELHEELGLTLDPGLILYRNLHFSRDRVWFLGALWPEFDPSWVRFGNEGQRWEAMPIQRFLTHPRAIPSHQHRLAQFLRSHPGLF